MNKAKIYTGNGNLIKSHKTAEQLQAERQANEHTTPHGCKVIKAEERDGRSSRVLRSGNNGSRERRGAKVARERKLLMENTDQCVCFLSLHPFP